VGQTFQCVVATYVLNVLVPQAREVAFSEIARATEQESGIAYITVRSDKDRKINGTPEADGVRTSISTFQVGFSKEKFILEASKHFCHVQQIKWTSGYRLFACSKPIL
jgi:hypothetical protein